MYKIEEVGWVEIQDNDVFIGFKRRSNDLTLILRGADLKGNKAIDFGVNVWAVDAKHVGWRPGSGPYYMEVTARHGRIE